MAAIKYTDIKQLRGEGVPFSSCFQATVNRCSKVSVGASGSHDAGSQEQRDTPLAGLCSSYFSTLRHPGPPVWGTMPFTVGWVSPHQLLRQCHQRHAHRQRQYRQSLIEALSLVTPDHGGHKINHSNQVKNSNYEVHVPVLVYSSCYSRTTPSFVTFSSNWIGSVFIRLFIDWLIDCCLRQGLTLPTLVF